MSDYPNNRVLRETGAANSYEAAHKATVLTVAELRAAAAKRGTEGSAAGAQRVLAPYTRLPLMTADPASSSGVKIDLSELADDVLAAIAAAGGGGSAALYTETFTPTVNGQTDFVLANVPGNVILFFINAAAPSTFVVIAPQTIRWTGGYQIKTTDRVRVVYN